MSSNISIEQINLRIDCFNKKLSPEQAIIICDCSKRSWMAWESFYRIGLGEAIERKGSLKPQRKKRVSLTNDDLGFYRKEINYAYIQTKE